MSESACEIAEKIRVPEFLSPSWTRRISISRSSFATRSCNLSNAISAWVVRPDNWCELVSSTITRTMSFSRCRSSERKLGFARASKTNTAATNLNGQPSNPRWRAYTTKITAKIARTTSSGSGIKYEKITDCITVPIDQARQ